MMPALTQRSLFVVTVLALLIAAARVPLHAQATPMVVGPGPYINLGVGASDFHFNYGERTLGGVTAWADIHPTWRYGLEAEVRSLRYNTDEDVTETTWLAGPHINIFPGHFRPYAKFLIGAGDYKLPFGEATGSFLTYAPGAGVDLQLNEFITVRAIDFEYQVTKNFQASIYEPPSNIVNYGLSAGISFRLTAIERIPRIFGYKKRSYGRGPYED